MEDLELVVRADFIDQMLAALEPVDRILGGGALCVGWWGAADVVGDGQSGRPVEGAHQAEIESGDSEDEGFGF